MKYFALVAAVIAIAFSSCERPKKEEAQYLFVLHAKSGRYASGRLMLDGVDQNIAFFSERPARHAGALKVDRFIKAAWCKDRKGNFQMDPPNAGLVSLEKIRKTYFEQSMELSDPQYNTESNALSFKVKFLGEKRLDENEQLTDVVLFIDCPPFTAGAVTTSGQYYCTI